MGWACVAHLSFCFEKTLYRSFHMCFLPNFRCLLTDRDEMCNSYRGPSIDASYQVSYHLAKRFQSKSCFRNRPIRKKNCLWRPCLLTDQIGMSNSHRGPYIDASYHVSVHLAKLLQSRRFFEIEIRNNNFLWWPCLLMIRTKWAILIENLP